MTRSTESFFKRWAPPPPSPCRPQALAPTLTRHTGSTRHTQPWESAATWPICLAGWEARTEAGWWTWGAGPAGRAPIMAKESEDPQVTPLTWLERRPPSPDSGEQLQTPGPHITRFYRHESWAREPSKLKEVKTFSPDDKFPAQKSLGEELQFPFGLSHPRTEAMILGLGIGGNWSENQVLLLGSWVILVASYCLWGFPSGTSGKGPTCQCRQT